MSARALRSLTTASERFDVVIVGGGVVGSSVAFHLAREQPSMRIAVVERDYAGFWGPYTSLSEKERAGFVDGNFQPWDKHHRPDLVEAQKKQLLSK